MISLSCRPSSDLQWDLSLVPSKGEILWYFDLGLEDPFFPIDDPFHFESIKMGLNKFSREIWPLYKERSRGAILYRGSADFSTHFLWTENQKENYEKWKQDSNYEFGKQIFTANAFVHYFQMLSFSLPDELPLFLFLDANIEGTLVEKHLLLSKERFQHFQVAIKDLPFTSEMTWDGKNRISFPEKPSRAICFPQEAMWTEEIQKKLESIFRRVKQPFRVISELFLNEDWEGVDELYVLEDAVSYQGKRKINGFLATGGNVSG